MSSIGSPSPFFIAGTKSYEIERSLRFNRDDNAFLSRTPSSAGNRKTWTYSAWAKLGQTGINTSTNEGNGLFLSCGAGSTAANMTLRITNNGYIGIDYYGVGGYYSSYRFRDPSAWYHLVWVMDTTESTAANRMKVYVNGNLCYNNSMSLSQNADTPINNNNVTRIGCYSYNTSHNYRLDAYLAEVNFLDGYAYDPSYFAETNAATGQWIPKLYTGSYGTNGFYLNFSDTSSLGTDSSGNGNNFTPSNFSVSDGIGDDSVEDTPTNNWCTLNPLHHRSINSSFSNANLQVTIPASNSTGKAYGSFVVYSGKWYWELKYTGNTGNYLYVGVSGADGHSYQRAVRGSDGELIPNTGTVSVSYTTNDIIMVALDVDNGKWYIGKNGSFMLSGDPVNGTGFVHSGLVTTNNGLTPFFQNATSTGSQTFNINFGQQGFTYTPPTGFVALNSENLPNPTIKKGNKYFDSVFYTGTGTTAQSITGLNFQPDFVWIKSRSFSNNHHLFDSIRGVDKILRASTNDDEDTVTGVMSAFNSDGFTVQEGGGNNATNDLNSTFAAWNWDAGDSTVTNNDGSITTQVRANTTAGFSIVGYTGTGSNATLGHGLGVKPDCVLLKRRTGGDNDWFLFHKDIGNTKNLRLNLSNSEYTTANIWNNTDPTSSVVNIGSSSAINSSGSTFIMYCFNEVSGYSKFGSYTGNGSSNGIFVFLGFEPAFVMTKGATAGEHWNIPVDVNFKNGINQYVSANLSSAERGNDDSNDSMDFLSNGFKIRTSDNNYSNNNDTFIYLAFAKAPFKYARAR